MVISCAEQAIVDAMKEKIKARRIMNDKIAKSGSAANLFRRPADEFIHVGILSVLFQQHPGE